jgi:hypothetical protein
MSEFETQVSEIYGPLMTAKELAEFLRVANVEHLNNKVRAGDIKLTQSKIGRQIYYKTNEVARLFSDQ